MDIDKIYRGDCRNILPTLPDNSVDCIATDVPYRVIGRGKSPTWIHGMMSKKRFSSGKVFTHNDCPPEDYARELYRVLKLGGHCYIFCNQSNLGKFLNVFPSAGFSHCKLLVWDKCRSIPTTGYRAQFEFILFLYKKPFQKINHCATSALMRFPLAKHTRASGGNYHDTEKPVALMETLISNSTAPGDLVLDPFAGIGTTLVAAKRLGRSYLGFEIDEEYFDIACKRIDDNLFHEFDTDVMGIEQDRVKPVQMAL